MKRRDALKWMAALSAAIRPAKRLFSQQPVAGAEPRPPEQTESSSLPLAVAEEAAAPGLHFFTPEEMTALERLAEVLVPRTRTPGAVEAGSPQFLDFYLSQSGRERQALYREGLARLNAEARRRFRAPFAGLGITEIDELLAPLRQPWTPAPAADPLAAFLRAATDELLRATMNSRQWASADRAAATTYWYPVD